MQIGQTPQQKISLEYFVFKKSDSKITAEEDVNDVNENNKRDTKKDYKDQKIALEIK